MAFERDSKKIKLTSAEQSQLWTSYINDSGAVCQLEFFLANVEDLDIKPIIELSLKISKDHLEKIEKIFNEEKFPIPYGYKIKEDVNISAPKLFSDSFVINYINQMSKIGLNGYSVALSIVTRNDIYYYFHECLIETTSLLKKSNEMLLSKGLYIHPPFIPYPEKIDFIKQQSFLTGFFGERRPLTGLEISNLYANFQRNVLGAATLIGFSQVTSSKEVKNYFIRGKEIAAKHNEIFSSILREDDIPVPMTWDTEISNSTDESTFSDKIMMFFTTSLIAIGIGYYGTSLAVSPRRDLGIHYTRLTQEILLYAEDGTNIMIKNGWMEEPPRALDRDKLAKNH